MKYVFQSGFAADIEKMLRFKEALGHRKESYATYLVQFDCFCAESFPGACLLTKEIVDGFSAGTNGIPRTPNCLKAVRELGKYLVSAGLNAYVIPASFTRQPRPDAPYPVTDEELGRFFAATDRLESSKNNRLLEYMVPVMFRLQFACGMRPQEVRRLKCVDFNFRQNTVYISESKKNKDRLLAVRPEIMEMCQKYDRIAERMKPGRTYFFPSARDDAYSSQSLTEMFHKCWEDAGNSLSGHPCTPYDLRHAYASRVLMGWIEQGKDMDAFIPYLSTYMGHERFQDTYYYVHMLPHRLSKMGFMDVSGIVPEVGDEK